MHEKIFRRDGILCGFENGKFEELTGYRFGYLGAGSGSVQYYNQWTGSSVGPIYEAGSDESLLFLWQRVMT